MKIQLRVFVAIMLVVLATTVANFFTNWSFTNKSLSEALERDLSFAIDIADGLVSSKIQLMKSKAISMAERLQRAEKDEEDGDIADIMQDHIAACPSCTAQALFNRDGIIAHYGVPISPEEMLMHRKQIDMAYSGTTVVSNPFPRSDTGEFVLNIYTPCGPDKVLVLTQPGLTFSELVSGYKLWKTGNIFILNREGTNIGDVDKELVLNQVSYYKAVEENPDFASKEDREMHDFMVELLANEKGIGTYTYKGVKRLCAYKRIAGSLLDWRVVVAAPLNESPRADVQQNLFYAALVFLSLGIIATAFMSGFIAQPYKELKRYHEVITLQSERIKILFDTVPLACCLWNKDFQIFECNDESLKLFNFNSKQELLDRYYEIHPEYQPDGHRSAVKAPDNVKRAFDSGKYVCEWSYRTTDGELIPTETTLVRVPYEDGYAVAGYSRDLREHNKMMLEIERRDLLRRAGNEIAEIMLTINDNDPIEFVLMKSMEVVGTIADMDRFQIWRNEIINGELCFVHIHEWLSDVGKEKPRMPIGLHFSYRSRTGWEEMFLRGDYINGPVSQLAPGVQKFLEAHDTKSVVIFPLFLQDEFWGLVSLGDCRKERVLSEDGIDILRSICLLIANAINRREASAKIREAHDNAKVLLDSMPLACRLWNKELKMIDCNEETIKLFQIKDKQAYLDHYYEYYPEYQPDGRPSKEKALESIQKAFDEGFCVLEWTHQAQDGTLIPSEGILVRVPYGGSYAVAVYTRDLREHKKMMREIERQENLLSTVNRVATILLQSSIDNFKQDLHRCMGMIAEAINVDRISIWKNSIIDGQLHYCQIFEYVSNVKLLTEKAKNEGWISVKEPRCYAEKAPYWKEVLSSGRCVSGLVRNMPPAEREHFGRHGLVSVFAAPVFLQDQFWGFVGYDNHLHEQVFSDNERTILLSASMVIANALLHNSFAEQLEAALKEAQRANDAKSYFLATMSHEMRTPLNAVIGLSGLCLENDALDKETHFNLVHVYDAGSTLLNTVNDILDISKIEAGRFELVEAEYDVPSMINDAVTQNVLRIGEKPIAFNLEIGNEMLTRLYGDEVRVKQIINNLLSNAIKYTNEGTVELNVNCVQDHDSVWVDIKVRDTGKGIRADDLDKLFEDYFQLDLASNREIEGTGLGLSIIRELAEMMNGSVQVESEFGKGSLFTVRIRQKFVTEAVISQETIESLKSLRYSDNKRIRNRRLNRVCLPYARVLIVDDNLTNLDVAKGLMKPYKMQIDCVTSGQQAIDIIRAGSVKYNAVFMDHMMPVMDGVEATQSIRNIGTDYAKNIPIIALTANAITGNEEVFLSKGFQAFLSKPIDVIQLDSVIRHWVRDKGLEQSLEKQHLLKDGQLLPDLQNGQDKRNITERRSGLDRRKSKTKFVGLNLDKVKERFGNDEETYRQILLSYTKNTRSLLESIEHVSEDTLSDYAVTIHGIKGSSRGIFADMIGDSAENLEKAANAGDFNYVRTHNSTFLDAAWKLIHDLDTMIADKNNEKQKPRMDKPEKSLLLKLMTACDEYDISRADEIVMELDKYEYETDNSLVNWLKDCIAKGYLEEIKKKLSTLEEQEVM